MKTTLWLEVITPRGTVSKGRSRTVEGHCSTTSSQRPRCPQLDNVEGKGLVGHF